MRRLAGLATAGLLVAGCAAAPAPGRDLALIQDAQACEEMAEHHLRESQVPDHAIRIAIFESCMALRGWRGR